MRKREAFRLLSIYFLKEGGSDWTRKAAADEGAAILNCGQIVR